MTDEKSSLATHQIITIKKPEQNANGAADGSGIGGNGSIFIATDDNDEDTVPLGLTTKAVCMQVSTRCGSLLNNPPPLLSIIPKCEECMDSCFPSIIRDMRE